MYRSHELRSVPWSLSLPSKQYSARVALLISALVHFILPSMFILTRRFRRCSAQDGEPISAIDDHFYSAGLMRLRVDSTVEPGGGQKSGFPGSILPGLGTGTPYESTFLASNTPSFYL